MNEVLLSTAYFAPIEFYHFYTQSDAVTIEHEEHFIKQTYRNRCRILGANGILDLSIPIQKYANNTPIKDIKISYDTSWQKQHWRSIISAYNSSPFFIYYDYELVHFFEKRFEFLCDLNIEILQKMNKLLKISGTFNLSKEFKALNQITPDYRFSVSPKIKPELKFKTYNQVFDQKFGFIENLSILDLLFNKGPESREFL